MFRIVRNSPAMKAWFRKFDKCSAFCHTSGVKCGNENVINGIIGTRPNYVFNLVTSTGSVWRYILTSSVQTHHYFPCSSQIADYVQYMKLELSVYLLNNFYISNSSNKHHNHHHHLHQHHQNDADKKGAISRNWAKLQWFWHVSWCILLQKSMFLKMTKCSPKMASPFLILHPRGRQRCNMSVPALV